MAIGSIHAAPTKMIRKPRGFGEFNEPLQPPKMFPVQRLGRTEIHRHAVLNDPIMLEDPVESRERTPAVDHVIFRDDLEPIDDRLLFEDVGVVRDTQSNPNAVIRERVESICRHGR